MVSGVDEIFFVDSADKATRMDLVRMLLRKRRLDSVLLDL